VALVHKRTILTERLPHVGEVSVNFLRTDGVAWSAQHIPTAVNLGFLDPEPLLFNSSSSSVTRLSYPVPDPLLLRKSGSAGNRPGISGSVARNSDHWTTEAVLG
jgi:hypothetical protein